MIVPLSFFAQSIVICTSLVFIQNIVWGQLASNFAIQTAVVILIAYQKPYESLLENRL